MEVSPSSSPLAFFASELKRLRGDAGVTQEQLAAAVTYSPSTIAAIETRRMIPSADLAERGDKFFKTDQYLARLQELVEETSVLPWFRDLPKMEQTANDIRVYEPYLIPALLQTEEYMRGVARAERPKLADTDIDKAVALRITRQEVLDCEERPPVNYEITPRLWAIMDECVLHRVVGSQQVMKEQYERLIALAVRPNTTIQVISNSQGATSALGRAFEIIVSANHDSLVYLEDIGSARYVRKTDEAARYLQVFDHLRASALDEGRTLQLIREIAK